MTLKMPIRLTLTTLLYRSRPCGPLRPTILAGGAIPAHWMTMRAGPFAFRALAIAASVELCIGDIADAGDAADLLSHPVRRVLDDIEHRYLGAGRCQRARGGLAETGPAAGDDCRLTLDFHLVSPLVVSRAAPPPMRRRHPPRNLRSFARACGRPRIRHTGRPRRERAGNRYRIRRSARSPWPSLRRRRCRAPRRPCSNRAAPARAAG